MKKIISFLLCAVLLFGFSSCQTKSNTIRFGTGSVSGTYYKFGSKISGNLSTKGFKFNIKSTKGSAANLRLISEGYLDMAIVQSDMLDNAWNSTGYFENAGLTRSYKAVCELYTEACQIVVRANSGINSVAELKGKTISVGEDESGVLQNAKRILTAAGIDFDLITPKYLSFSDSADALKDGKIDAFFCTSGTPTLSISNLSQNTEIEILNIDDELLSGLIDSYGVYVKSVIPANTYNGVAHDVTTLGVRAVLIASDNMETETVYNFLKAMFEDETVNDLNPIINEEFSINSIDTESVTIPFNDGAIKFFNEMTGGSQN